MNNQNGQQQKISVLIIDNTPIYREILDKIIGEAEDLTVVGKAPNGNIGLLKALELKPNVIIYDAEIKDILPTLFTRQILEKHRECGLILTTRKGLKEDILQETLQSLENGAFDFVEKPDDALIEEQKINFLKRKLLIKIRGYSIKRYTQIVKNATGHHIPHEQKAVTLNYINKEVSRYKLLAIGVSTGGPMALSTIIPQLPENFPMPVVIVIHLPKLYTSGIAKELEKKAKLKVKEAQDGERLNRGNVYIAQGGLHLKVEKVNGEQFILKYNDEPPVNNCKPSVDVLFQSAAQVYKNEILAMLLTGMGDDGARGLKQLKDQGAYTIAQDKETSVVWGMPGSAVQMEAVIEILPLEKMIARVMELI